MKCLFFCYFQKIFVRCVWDFCFDQEVAHQTTEIFKRPCSAFPKEIKKKWFRKFIPSSISSATSSKPRFTKPDSPRKCCCLSLFNYYFAFLFCCSLTRLSSLCQKGPRVTKTAAVNNIQSPIGVFLLRLVWVYFAVLETWLLLQSTLPLIFQLSKAAKFVLAVFALRGFAGQVLLLFLSCSVWYLGINTPGHIHTQVVLSTMLLVSCD